MPLPPSSSDSASDRDGEALSNAQTFEQALVEIERSLHDLKERYAQVQEDEQTQAQLRQRKEQLKQQMARSSNAELKAELTHLQTQLNELEINLESRLFSWGSLREPFWQIVRFGGLGLVIGWSIAVTTLHNPPPGQQPSVSAPQVPQQ